jgi:hypothetical protein
MADLKEQRASVKFCFLLEKTAAAAVTMLGEVFKDKAMVKHKCMSGLIISSDLKYLLKTSRIVATVP